MQDGGLKQISKENNFYVEVVKEFYGLDN